MDDEQQVVTAEPSTATEQQSPFASGKLTREIEESWREGKEVAPVKQKSGSAEASASETKSGPNGKSAAESEAAKEQERGKASAKDRIDQLSAREKAAIERAEKAERERDELRAAQAKPAEAAKPATAQAQPQAGDDPEPQEPKWEDYAGKPYTEYQAALNKYNRELAMWAGRQEFKKHQAAQAEAERSKAVNAQVAEARQAYKDWDTVAKPAMEAIMGDMKDMVNTGAHFAVKQAINESPYAAHLIYVLATGKEGDTVADFVKLSRENPRKALMKLGAIETLLVPELEKARKEIEAKSKEYATPAKTATEEPKPPAKPNREVGNRGTGPNDVAADAVRRNDFSTFEKEQTRKAAQRRGLN